MLGNVVIKRDSSTLIFFRIQKGVCQVNRDDDGSTLLIKNAEGCRLSFPCSPKTVYLEGVRDSTLVFFPVRTSILMRNCERMSLVAAAQQVRIHDSTALRLYIHVDTAVIIEGCSGVEVAPYRLAEAGSLDAKYSRNSEEALKCAKIQDFDCVVGESPNWKVMDQALWKEFHALNVFNEE